MYFVRLFCTRWSFAIVVTKTGNDQKRPQTARKRPQTTTNDRKSPANDHKFPQTNTSHQQTTTIIIKPNKTFPNSNYLVFSRIQKRKP